MSGYQSQPKQQNVKRAQGKRSTAPSETAFSKSRDLPAVPKAQTKPAMAESPPSPVSPEGPSATEYAFKPSHPPSSATTSTSTAECQHLEGREWSDQKEEGVGCAMPGATPTYSSVTASRHPIVQRLESATREAEQEVESRGRTQHRNQPSHPPELAVVSYEQVRGFQEGMAQPRFLHQRAKSADQAVAKRPAPAFYERSAVVARSLLVSEDKGIDDHVDEKFGTVSEDGTDHLLLHEEEGLQQEFSEEEEQQPEENQEFDDGREGEGEEDVDYQEGDGVTFEQQGHEHDQESLEQDATAVEQMQPNPATSEEAIGVYDGGRGYWVPSEQGYYVPEYHYQYGYGAEQVTDEGEGPSGIDETHELRYGAEMHMGSDGGEDDIGKKGLPQACLFVASLSSARTDEQLLKSVTEHFVQWGPLANVKVLKDWMGRPYAFVQFENVEDAKRALEEAHNTVVDNRHIRVEQARVNRTLFIAKFNRTQPEVVREVLGQYGPVEDLTILQNYQTGKSKGCGFVKYCFREDAIKAFLGLRQLRWVVEWAANLDRGNIEVDLRSIFVGQLNQTVITQPLLEERFGTYGAIESLQLVNKFPYDSRPAFAFIKYVEEASAERAVVEEASSSLLQCFRF
ncbi:hypothetical protein HDU67_002763 [Dinochytrium kinnereticum]|nr:hypothetical protein HDU67_002763 [Dinochytrium kinnereticum]